MKLTNVLPLAALTTAFVIPDEQVMNQVAIESHKTASSILDKIPSKDQVHNCLEDIFSSGLKATQNAFDQAVDRASEAGEKIAGKLDDAATHTKSWLESAPSTFDGHHGHHGHHGKPNLTVYQLISESKYTTKLTKLINDYPDLVKALNGTAANYTVFAPIDSAFEKIPEDAPKPSKEDLQKVLEYHVSDEFYPAGRVLVTHTIPTLLEGEDIGFERQRLSTNIGLRGLTVNFYSRIIAIDIVRNPSPFYLVSGETNTSQFGTNGVIHGVDSILIPPPKVVDIISLLPGEFSALELGLAKTGLIPGLNDTSNHIGGTLFAPSNFAFLKLGPRINAFLFSSYGQKYLKALLKYHVVANQTLYSDAFYKADSVEGAGIPKGYFHVDLPTMLEDKSLSIDIGRYGRLISIKINGFADVTIEDGIAADGVIQVISNVLIPPKSVGGVMQQWQGEELSEEEFKDRFEPFVGQDEL